MPVVYIALWVLWPIATLAGGLALAPLTGLAAILLLPFCVARLRGSFFELVASTHGLGGYQLFGRAFQHQK